MQMTQQSSLRAGLVGVRYYNIEMALHSFLLHIAHTPTYAHNTYYSRLLLIRHPDQALCLIRTISLDKVH